MTFAHPLALLLLLLLIPIGLLYWLRQRVPRAVVGTGLFWQTALAEEMRRARWQRWRTPVSLIIQTLIVLLLALAAAGPAIPAAQRIVLILDNSATMRASDVAPSRFDAARDAAKAMIASLRWCDEMAIVTTSLEPQELQPMTSNQALLGTAVDTVQAEAAPPSIAWSVKLAREIHSPDQVPARIVLITDACAHELTREAQASGVEVLRVGTPTANRAITCLTARRSKADPIECEVFVEAQNYGNQSAQGSVGLNIDEKPGEPERSATETEPFAMERDGRWQHVFQLKLPSAARLTAKITPSDVYAFDDAATVDVPAPPGQHRVNLIADDRSSLKAILAANPRVRLAHDDADAATIHVFDGNSPEKLPSGPVLVLTPAVCDLWQLGDPIADPLITRADEASTIAAGVRLVDAYLPEARQLQINDAFRGLAKPILWAEHVPLGYAIDRPQGRVVVICGNLATSNLPLQADFPKLIAQALDWLAGQQPWKDTVFASGIANGSQGIADLRVPSEIGSEAATMHYDSPRMPLWIPLAAAAAVLMILEWCLYQRRWTS